MVKAILDILSSHIVVNYPVLYNQSDVVKCTYHTSAHGQSKYQTKPAGGVSLSLCNGPLRQIKNYVQQS